LNAMKKIMLVFGTRPEAIKMCPLVNELKKRAGAQITVCVTGQHRQMLDQVLAAYIEKAHGRADLLADGFDEATVDTVMRLVDRAEWKRRQYPLGPKVTALAFGRDRRLPITSAFRE